MAAKSIPENQKPEDAGDDSKVENTLLKNHFVRALGQLERLHRCLLELIKLELDRQISTLDVTSAQAVSTSAGTSRSVRMRAIRQS